MTAAVAHAKLRVVTNNYRRERRWRLHDFSRTRRVFYAQAKNCANDHRCGSSETRGFPKPSNIGELCRCSSHVSKPDRREGNSRYLPSLRRASDKPRQLLVIPPNPPFDMTAIPSPDANLFPQLRDDVIDFSDCLGWFASRGNIFDQRSMSSTPPFSAARCAS